MIQDTFANFGRSGCLFFAYAKAGEILGGGKKDIYESIKKLVSTGAVRDDAFINSGAAVVSYFADRDIDVVKCTSRPVELCAALYSINGRDGHWVLLGEDGKIIFNSLNKSLNVATGKQIDWRRFVAK